VVVVSVIIVAIVIIVIDVSLFFQIASYFPLLFYQFVKFGCKLIRYVQNANYHTQI
jgi:hypothetical protein